MKLRSDSAEHVPDRYRTFRAGTSPAIPLRSALRSRGRPKMAFAPDIDEDQSPTSPMEVGASVTATRLSHADGI